MGAIPRGLRSGRVDSSVIFSVTLRHDVRGAGTPRVCDDEHETVLFVDCLSIFLSYRFSIGPSMSSTIFFSSFSKNTPLQIRISFRHVIINNINHHKNNNHNTHSKRWDFCTQQSTRNGTTNFPYIGTTQNMGLCPSYSFHYLPTSTPGVRRCAEVPSR